MAASGDVMVLEVLQYRAAATLQQLVLALEDGVLRKVVFHDVAHITWVKFSSQFKSG